MVYLIAILFLWLGVFLFWIFLSICLLASYTNRWIFGYDTDPDPPGGEESDPSEGRFSHLHIENEIAKAQLSLRL